MLLRITELSAPEKQKVLLWDRTKFCIYTKSRALGLNFTKNELRRLEQLTDAREG